MKILYLHQYFTTPQRGGGTRSYEFSKYFVAKGHQVVVVTSHNDPDYRLEHIDGIEVHWIPNYYSNELGIAGRLNSFLTFLVKSFFVSLKIGNADICYATSTPLTIGITALLLKWFKGLPYIFEVRDLWPEFPIQMGAIKNRFLIRCAYACEKLIYKNAESIVALSPGMQEGILKYGLKQEVIVLPNSSDLEIFYPHEKHKEIMKQFGLENKFNVVHFGAMGIANGLGYIIETAKICMERHADTIQFVLIGSGTVEKQLQSAVESYHLRNVIFPGFLPKPIVAEIVNACDISIVSFLNLPVLYTNSPNKLFDSFAAGKVCFVNSKGWTKELVEKHKCGFYVSPESPHDFFEKIMALKGNTDLQKQMQLNARALAEQQFDRKKLAEKLLQQIEKASCSKRA